jgi:tripartite-type tricarboxylate transporter receptor subunit TctC
MPSKEERSMSFNKLLKALLLLPLLLGAQAYAAQNYPNKSIRLIVGFAPGGPNDIVARMVGQRLNESLGVPVIVDNRPGANSMIGMQITSRALPDGYTIGIISASAATNPSVYSDVPFDLMKDFTPVSLVAAGAFIVVVHPSLQVKSVKELIALARARPGQLNFASSGVGGTLHLAGELFKSMAGVDMNHIPYKGGAPAAMDLVAGQVQLMFSPLAVAMPHVRSGKLVALAVTSAKRSELLPEMPTVAEAGLAGYETTGWYGVVGPAGLPAPILTRLNREIVKSLALPEMRQQFAKMDLDPLGGSPEDMRKHLQVELMKWAKVVKDAKLPRGRVQ